MARRENYYLILDLDPGESDSSIIEKRIQQKQREWAKQRLSGPPNQKRRVAGYLEDLEDIKRVMSNPEARVAEAKEAKRQLQRARQQRLEHLNEQIALLAQGGCYNDDDIELVHRQLNRTFSETEIEQRFQRAGLKRSTVAKATARQSIDPTVAKAIRANLDHLSLGSLYDFLGLKPHNTPAELCRRADEIYTELKRVGKTDVDATTRSDLTGQCKRIFANAQEKAKYDYTLSIEVLEELKPNLEVAGRNRYLSLKMMGLLISQAVARGVLPEQARNYIEEYAAKRKWGIQSADDGARATVARMCGYCGTLADSEKATACAGCGEPLEVTCPNCSAPVPTMVGICARCGCDTGDASLVHALMAEARKRVADGELTAARQRLQRVLVIWPRWQPAQTELNSLQSKATQLETQIEAIEKLITKRYLAAARQRLDQVMRNHGRAAFSSLERRIQDGLRQAAELVVEGKTLVATGNQNAALERFSQALALQADCDEAQQALLNYPPASPTKLRVNPYGNGFKLMWSGPALVAGISYHLVRKVNGLPADPDDGVLRKQLHGNAYVDADVTPGKPWYYAVYTRRGPVICTTPAVSGPHLLLAEVEMLTVVPGDRQVSLSWRRSPGCMGVEVRRCTGAAPPRQPDDGVAVAVSGDSCVDIGLTNGSTVSYLVTALFADPAHPGRHLRSRGLQRTTVPTAPSAPIKDLIAERRGQQITLRWTPPARGTVQLRYATRVPDSLVGDLLDLRQADQLGKLIPVQTQGRASVRLTSTTSVIIPLSIEGETAVVGKWEVVTSLDTVTDLRSRSLGGNIVLTWQWPGAIDTVQICYAYEGYPKGPEDRDAARLTCSRTEYDRRGNWELRAVEDRPHYFSLYSAATPDGPFSAPAKCFENMGQCHEVRYCVVKAKLLPFLPWVRGMGIKLQGESNLRLENLVLVAKPYTLPVSPSDGVMLQELNEIRLDKGQAYIPIHKQHWNRNTVVRLFFHLSADAERVRLLHGGIQQMRLG